MRIMLLTEDRETARRYLAAAQEGQARLSVLHGAAQALERCCREPFDALLADAGIRRLHWMERTERTLRSLFFLLPRGTTPALPTAAVYAFPKTSPPETVLRRIGELSAPQRNRTGPENAVISAALQGVGVPTHMVGFPLLKDAIRLALRQNRPTELCMQTDVYARLAESTHKSVPVVEHAMRHAIDAAWLRADARVLERLFGYTVSADRATPSNEAFVFQMCEHIRIARKEGIA